MYVVGYPESQTHWLAYLLTYCLNTEYSDLDSPNNLSKDKDFKSYLQGNLTHTSHQAQLGKIIRTHSISISQQDKTPIVYLVRDGRDVMLSYYYRQQSSLSKDNPHIPQKTLTTKIYRKLGFRELANRLELPPFSRFLENHLSEWVSHVNTWLEHKPIAIIRYEDLLAIPEEALASLIMRLGVKVSPKVIQEAIKIFHNKRLLTHQVNKNQNKSIGKPGDWEKHFSQADSTYFQEIGGKLLYELGYEGEI